MEITLNQIVIWHGKEYSVMRFQKEGIRLKGTKNNPLGAYEVVVDECEIEGNFNKTEGRLF